MTDGALDHLVRRAQAGDAEALNELLSVLRRPLLAFARRLPLAAEREDVVQEALVDIARGVGGYRWEASFLSWAYAVCARRLARRANAASAEIAVAAEELERLVAGPADPLEPEEQVLLAQDAHLACAFVVALELPALLRRAYVVGEALGASDRVGAEVCACAPATFRQRLSRARRLVRTRIRDLVEQGAAVSAGEEVGRQLDRLVTLGELHRATGREAPARAVERAGRRAAPSLFA